MSQWWLVTPSQTKHFPLSSVFQKVQKSGIRHNSLHFTYRLKMCVEVHVTLCYVVLLACLLSSANGIRITHTDCLPELAWAENTPNGSIIYRGMDPFVATDALKLAGIDQSKLTMVQDNMTGPASTHLLNHLKVVAQGKADFTMLLYPFKRAFVRQFDVSPGIYHKKIVIVSRHLSDSVQGNFLKGMFDKATFALVFLSLLILAIALTFFLEYNILYALVDTLNVTFENGWHDISTKKKWPLSLTSFVSCYFVAQLVLVACFNGQLYSLLMKKESPKNIDTLQDLMDRPHLKIIVYAGTEYHR